MGEIQGADDAQPQLRVGNAERRAAMNALDTHLEAGRLDVEAYGDRSAAASTAVFRGDLAALFVDLPAPHPVLPRRPGEPAVPVPAPVAGGGVAGVAGTGVAPGVPVGPVGPVEGMAFGLVIMLVFAVPAILATGAHLGALLMLPLVVLLAGGTVGGAVRRRRGGHAERDEG